LLPLSSFLSLRSTPLNIFFHPDAVLLLMLAVRRASQPHYGHCRLYSEASFRTAGARGSVNAEEAL
jgi:hypothetical protein